MNKTSKLHMSTKEFREEGYKVIDWIADYYDQIEDYPVFPKVKPGDVRSSLPALPPVTSRKYNEILKVIVFLIPCITLWQSP